MFNIKMMEDINSLVTMSILLMAVEQEEEEEEEDLEIVVMVDRIAITKNLDMIVNLP